MRCVQSSQSACAGRVRRVQHRRPQVSLLHPAACRQQLLHELLQSGRQLLRLFSDLRRYLPGILRGRAAPPLQLLERPGLFQLFRPWQMGRCEQPHAQPVLRVAELQHDCWAGRCVSVLFAGRFGPFEVCYFPALPGGCGLRHWVLRHDQPDHHHRPPNE